MKLFKGDIEPSNFPRRYEKIKKIPHFIFSQSTTLARLSKVSRGANFPDFSELPHLIAPEIDHLHPYDHPHPSGRHRRNFQRRHWRNPTGSTCTLHVTRHPHILILRGALMSRTRPLGKGRCIALRFPLLHDGEMRPGIGSRVSAAHLTPLTQFPAHMGRVSFGNANSDLYNTQECTIIIYENDSLVFCCVRISQNFPMPHMILLVFLFRLCLCYLYSI